MARKFPDSAVQWASDYPTITTPVGIWTFQEVASPIDDKIGALDLAQNAAGPVYGVTGDPTGRTAIGYTTVASAQFFGTGETTFGNLVAGTPFSLWIRMRMPDNATSVRSVVGKGTVSPRWNIRFINGGRFQWFFENAGGTNSVSPTPTYDDGLYHDILLVYDPTENTNGTLHVYVDAADHLSLALTNFGWTSPGGVISAGEFRVGASGGSTQLGNADQALASQVSYMAIWNVAISAAQWAAILTSDQAGSFDSVATATVELAGVTDSPGSMVVDAAATVAMAGLVDAPGAMQVEASALVEISEGQLGAFGSLAAGGSAELVIGTGLLGILGSFSAEAVATPVFQWELPPDEGQFQCAAFATVTMDSVLVSPEPVVSFPLVGLRGVISSLSTGTYTVQRRREGEYDQGIYVKSVIQTFQILAVVQPGPSGGRRLGPGKEGRMAGERKLVITNTQLRTVSPGGDADVIIIEGEPYEVFDVERWDAFGNTHFECLVARQVVP